LHDKKCHPLTRRGPALGAIAWACATLAIAQTTAPSTPTQRIEITGSSIKRVDAEGPAPVEIYTRKDIERTGATTVSELIKNIATIDISEAGEVVPNSPSGSGTINLQIRGLSERNVLVLLNGRRLPINALTDGSGAGAAVDVNNIPLSAIERLEILKDGGSAIYGSDAVAGVINFITKKNYTGLEARLGLGTSSRSDGEEQAGGVVAGFGDYDRSGFNVLMALDVFKRDPVFRADREITRSADWRRYDGRTDSRSPFHPNGNILNAAGTSVVGQVVPCPPEDVNGINCVFDFNKTLLTAINRADRWSSMLIGNLKLGDVRAFGELVYSESKDLFENQPAPGIYTDAQGRRVRGRFMQVGPRTTNRDSSLLSTTLGLEGSAGRWDWDAAIGQGVSKVTNRDKNYLHATRFNQAIAAGRIDPTSNTNPTAEVDALRLTPLRTGRSENRFLHAKVSGSLMDLGGGSLGVALGVQTNKDSLRDQPDDDSQNGRVFGSIAQAPVDASRDLKAAFVEFALPFTKSLEAQIAVRTDRYGGATGTLNDAPLTGEGVSRTSPKFAIKYKPFANVALRASHARSFLAPTLKQMFGGQDEGAETTSDRALCAAFGVPAVDCVNFPYRNVTGSNPNLKPETGETTNLGIVFEPAPPVSMAVDLWRVKKDNEVSTPSVDSAVAQGLFSRRANGEWQVFTNNQNIAGTITEGVDLEVRMRFGSTHLGQLSLRNASTYYRSVRNRLDAADPFDEYVGTFNIPRWRNTLALTLDRGSWSHALAVRSTAGMRDTEQAVGTTGWRAARRVGAHEELDWTVQYTGIKDLTLSGAVKNLLDNGPPFSQRGTLNQNGSLGFPLLYSPRGRFFQFTANYRFV
jgi:iron complex outermembrane recepter protein